MKSTKPYQSLALLVYYTISSVYTFYRLLLLLGGAGFVAGVVTSFLKYQPIVPISILLGATGALGYGLSFWRRTMRERLSSLNPNLSIKSQKFRYVFTSDSCCYAVREIELKVKIPTDHYIGRFYWTGMGQYSASIVYGASQIVIEESKNNLYNKLRVIFDSSLAVGAIHKFAYRIDLHHPTTEIRPFLGTVIDCEACKLTMLAELPPGQTVLKYKRQRFISSTSETPIWQEDVVVADGISGSNLEYSEGRALHGYLYKLSW